MKSRIGSGRGDSNGNFAHEEWNGKEKFADVAIKNVDAQKAFSMFSSVVGGSRKNNGPKMIMKICHLHYVRWQQLFDRPH